MNVYLLTGSVVGVLLWTVLAYCMGRKQGKDHASQKYEQEKEAIGQLIVQKQEKYSQTITRLQGERDNLINQLIALMRPPSNITTISQTDKATSN